jgi:hypothetical protein
MTPPKHLARAADDEHCLGTMLRPIRAGGLPYGSNAIAGLVCLAACSQASAPDGGAPDASGSEDGAITKADARVSRDGSAKDGARRGTDAASKKDVTSTDVAVADAARVSDAPMASDASVVVAPSPAVAAGYETLMFEDDFTTTDTIAPTQSASSGYKWYWSFDGTTQPWVVHTTATAASISNGNMGGGSNASPRGGILTVNGPGEPNDALITVPGAALNNGAAVLPAEGDGCWSHAYFEAYIQFQIDGNSSADASTGWPAFWSWSIQGLRGYGFGSSSLSTASYSEIDFMETYGTIFSNQPGNWTATMHQWPANMSSDGDTQHTDSNWHTYGCLWTSTGTGTGQVKFYFDGAQVDNTVETGAGQTQFSLEGMYQFIVLGSGKDWDMNVDWVRVWQ